MKFLSKLKPFSPILILLIIELVLFATNYLPGTYFLGWDNLFPELNFRANIQRGLFAIWEQYRGLGFLDGMSFAANLPHYLFLYATSFVLPQSLLRYFFIFFMHFLGGAGLYFLVRTLLGSFPHVKLISFLSALFYLFNLTTVQMFYAPYELFAIHFAALPWLLLAAINYLESGTKRSLIIFSLLTLISIPQAHVPTVFIVYFLALCIVIVFELIKQKSEGFKKALIIILLTILINAFWALPYAYYGITSSKTTIDSKINQMATETIHLNNKARGDLIDVALLKGFWLDYVDYQTTGKHDYIMPVWRIYSQTSPFTAIGITFFLLSLAGLVEVVRKKRQNFYPFVITFLFSFTMLGIDIPILNLPFNVFSDYIPFFSQTFRFVFTKFSILYAFSFSILLAIGLSLVLDKLHKIRLNHVLLALGFILLLSYYTFPSFQGNFIYKSLRIKIPNDYFRLVDYFNKQNVNGRIALLPQDSYWGWTYNNWGYRGSGFIWYGLPQASLDGSTFPWSQQNENYYWELDQAVNTDNPTYFVALLQKYQINWIVLDRSVVNQYSSKASLNDNLRKLLENSSQLSLTANFGKIYVYRVIQNLPQNNFVSLATNLPKISPKYSWNNFDTAFLQNGNYINVNTNSASVYYPFRSLFTGREQKELEFNVSDRGTYFSFNAKLPQNLQGAVLILPKVSEEEVSEITGVGLSKEVAKYPQVYINNQPYPAIPNSVIDTRINISGLKGETIEIRVPKIGGYYSYSSETNGGLFNRFHRICNPFATGTTQKEKISENGHNILRVSDYNYSDCFDFDLTNLSQRIGYLVTVKSRNLQGKSLLLSIINKTSQKPDFESNLPENKNFNTSYFVIPPMEQYGLGYDLYFDNVSLGNVRSVNDLMSVTVNQIPYDFLTGLRIELANSQTSSNYNAKDIDVSHPNPSLYSIKLNEAKIPNTTLILSQSFDSGWKAYQVGKLNFLSEVFPFFFGKEVKNHVLVNNWENGWVLEPQNGSSNIIIVYLPQYLEYLGFAVLMLALLAPILPFLASKRPRRNPLRRYVKLEIRHFELL